MWPVNTQDSSCTASSCYIVAGFIVKFFGPFLSSKFMKTNNYIIAITKPLVKLINSKNLPFSNLKAKNTNEREYDWFLVGNREIISSALVKMSGKCEKCVSKYNAWYKASSSSKTMNPTNIKLKSNIKSQKSKMWCFQWWWQSADHHRTIHDC